jgi:hypothetical protein
VHGGGGGGGGGGDGGGSSIMCLGKECKKLEEMCGVRCI